MQRNYRGICNDEKTINSGKMVFGYYVKTDENSYIIEVLGEDSFIWNKVNPETVGQYTGLKDKNGKEVYHKDVLKDKYKESVNFGVIEQEPDSCNLYIAWHFKRNYDGKECWDTNELPLRKVKDCVIVENCFDNPELLQEVDKQ
jgi:uncharacterized phage protein (TIGR01671 family)